MPSKFLCTSELNPGRKNPRSVAVSVVLSRYLELPVSLRVAGLPPARYVYGWTPDGGPVSCASL